MAATLGADLFGDDDNTLVSRPTDIDARPEPDSRGVEAPGYELMDILGQGGAGVVWLARECVPPRREVALKILKPELTTGDAGVRFEAEMAALALMDHPGIARVYGSGKTTDGRPYFAMERINGAPITEFCASHGLGVRERLAIFQKLCEAIAHAHRRGIIHRDIKPSNVLVAGDEKPFDGRTTPNVAQPKVIDFGIAKATENLLTDQTLLTHANMFMGPPAYMSPEQAAMQNEAIDTRTDIYSLGVLLYELITGTPAFPSKAKEFAKLPYDEMVRKIRTEESQRASTVIRRRTEHDESRVSTDLDWIVMKALEKDPAPVWRAVFDDSSARQTLLTVKWGGVARRWDSGGIEEVNPPAPRIEKASDGWVYLDGVAARTPPDI